MEQWAVLARVHYEAKCRRPGRVEVFDDAEMRRSVLSLLNDQNATAGNHPFSTANYGLRTTRFLPSPFAL